MSECDHQTPDGEADESESLPQKRARGPAAWVGLKLVRFYQQAISPHLPPSCRYQPTCSEYTRIAVRKYGFLKGFWLGLKRVLRCHPFHPGGHDPVP